MLSTFGPPRLAGALASIAAILILPRLEFCPVYIKVSWKLAPLIPVTLVLTLVVVARTFPLESLILRVIVNVSAAPCPPQHPLTAHSPFCTSTILLRVIPLLSISWVIVFVDKLNCC